ncbi:MAG TPA: hypothetical protein VKT81_10870 [Bryobacteraceae bacterium]|nr:hypothetical protein [Bryobacteraceae bacterium]
MNGKVPSKTRSNSPNQRLIDWLLACPQKGFFVPIDSESTDTLTFAYNVPTRQSLVPPPNNPPCQRD